MTLWGRFNDAGSVGFGTMDGDTITIDAVSNSIVLEISDAEMEKRRKAWTPPEPRFTRGVLAKYARVVSSASTGAVTDLP